MMNKNNKTLDIFHRRIWWHLKFWAAHIYFYNSFKCMCSLPDSRYTILAFARYYSREAQILLLEKASCFLGYKLYLILCSMAICAIWKCKLRWWCDHIMTKLLHSLNQLHASQYRRHIRNNKFHWSTPGETISFDSYLFMIWSQTILKSAV